MKRWLIVAAVIALTALFAWRYTDINSKYPDPGIFEAGIGETIQMGSYSITLSSVERHDGSYLQELLPRRTGSAEIRHENEHILLAEITIRSLGSNNTYMDLSEIAAEAGAWYNHFDMEVFSALNPGVSMNLHIGETETVSVIIPVIMLNDSFPEHEWVNIAERSVSLVFGCYPDKYILKL